MKYNILFIVIDGLRADRCLGTRSCKTPNLDAFIKKGIGFSQAFSSGDFSTISMGTVFTGLFPSKVGLFNKKFHKISSKVKTYPKILKDFGYHIYATMIKGFDSFGFFPPFDDTNYEYDAKIMKLDSEVIEDIITKLKTGEMKTPWFYYIHTLDLHELGAIPKQFDEVSYGATEYDRRVSCLDFYLGKLFDSLNLKNTIMILTADHGEYTKSFEVYDKKVTIQPNFLEKQAWRINQLRGPLRTIVGKLMLFTRKRLKERRLRNFDEGSLSEHEEMMLFGARNDNTRFIFDDLVHVPLIFVGPEIPKNLLIDKQVGTVDIFPTISEMIKLEIEPDSQDGKSLIPFFKGSQIPERPIYMASTTLREKTDIVIGLRTGDYKYFRSYSNPTKHNHLYDLKNDPFEINNIFDEKKDIVAEMEKRIKEIETTDLDDKTTELTSDELDKVKLELKKLGYI